MPYELKQSDRQEREALSGMVGKTVIAAYRGNDGWSDRTIFLVFEGGAMLHILDARTLYFNAMAHRPMPEG